MLAEQSIGGLCIAALRALQKKVVVISCNTARLLSAYLAEVKLRSDNMPLKGLLWLQVVLRPASRNSSNT